MTREARSEAALALLMVRNDEFDTLQRAGRAGRHPVIAAIYARILVATLCLLAAATGWLAFDSPG